jgi:hypothetical protein
VTKNYIKHDTWGVTNNYIKHDKELLSETDHDVEVHFGRLTARYAPIVVRTLTSLWYRYNTGSSGENETIA